MESPFVNDPFAMVWQAFKNLYPGKDCEVQWQPGIQDDGCLSRATDSLNSVRTALSS